MEPRDVIRIATIDEFNELLDSLNLSDRQRKIFILKYSHLWRVKDIAKILDIHKNTVDEDLRIIREKLAKVNR